MPQENTALNTQNTSGGLFGSFFGGLSNLIKDSAPVAANLYTLKLQGNVLSQQAANQNQINQAMAQQQLDAAAGTKTAAGYFKPWMMWAVVGLLGLLGLSIYLRRR